MFFVIYHEQVRADKIKSNMRACQAKLTRLRPTIAITENHENSDKIPDIGLLLD